MAPLIDFFKLQSADFNNKDLIEFMFNQKKPVIMSIGGTTYENIKNTVELARNNDVVLSLLHCTAIYPLDFKNVNLNNIVRLQELFPNTTIGYSGHEKGIAVSVAAVALGARIIERHFTLDRTMKGGDQAASLEPQGFEKMVRDIRSVEEALGCKEKVVHEDELKKLKGLNDTRKDFYWRS